MGNVVHLHARCSTAADLPVRRFPAAKSKVSFFFRLTFAGMAASDAVAARSRRSGLPPLQPGQGLDALAALLAATNAGRPLVQAAAVPVDWSVVLKKARRYL